MKYGKSLKQGKAKRIAQYVSLVHDKSLEGNVDLLKLYLRTQAGWTENRFEEEVRELTPIQICVMDV